MKTTSLLAAAAAVLVVANLRPMSAETAKFRHLLSVYADEKGVGLKQPEGVACGDRGRLVIGDTGNDRVLVFTYQGEKVSGGREIKVPELSAPSLIQLGPSGDIYAFDAKRRRIVRLDAEGTFKAALAFKGVPPPATIVVKSFRIDAAGAVYVLDVFGARVLVLDEQGQFQRAVPFPDDARFITDVAVDPTGRLVVIDALARRLFAASKDGTSFAPLGGDLRDALVTLPSSLTATRNAIFVVEGIGSDIVTFGADASFLARQLTAGWRDGLLNHPSQMCVSDKDEVFIADRDNSRVQVFGLIR